jgi:EPS-associated MarR family transcriptional regulator
VNYCLNALVVKGLIKIQNFRNNKNKWVYVYLLTPKGLTEKSALTESFLKRKKQEYEKLRLEIESLTLEVELIRVVEVASGTSQEDASNVKSGVSVIR